jgi:hypothetical protein
MCVSTTTNISRQKIYSANKTFGRIQIDRIAEMQKWAENINNVQERMNIAIVAANNHYAGFGPDTVNIFRNMIGLPEANWEEKEMEI